MSDKSEGLVRGTRFSSLHPHVKRKGWVISYREIRLNLDPFSVIFPEEAPGHKLSSQRDDDDRGQQELDQTPESNLDFSVRVRLFWSNFLPSSKSFVSFALTCEIFLVLLLLLMAILLVPDYKQQTYFRSLIREADEWIDRKRWFVGP